MKKYIKSLLRAIRGYKYKIVYTHIKISPERTRRYLCKLPIEADNYKILQNLPDFANNGYMPPIILWYSRNDKNLLHRKEIGNTADVKAVYKEYFK